MEEKKINKKTIILLIIGVFIIILAIFLNYKYLNNKKENINKEETSNNKVEVDICSELNNIDSDSIEDIELYKVIKDENQKEAYLLFSFYREYKNTPIYVLQKEEDFFIYICDSSKLIFISEIKYIYYIISKIELSTNSQNIYPNVSENYFVIEGVGTFGVKEKRLISNEEVWGEAYVNEPGDSRIIISPHFVSTISYPYSNILDLRTGNTILKNNYYNDVIVDEVEPKYVRVAISKKYGLIDLNNNVLIPIENDFISRSKNYFVTIQNGSLKVYDQNFNNILKKEILITKKENYEYLDFRPDGESNQIKIYEGDNEIVIVLGNFLHNTKVTINKNGEFVNIEEHIEEN